MTQFVVHVGKVNLKYDHSPVLASTILQDAGAVPPAEFVLEQLQHPNGPPEHEFQPADEVALGPHDKFFRAVPSGGGRA